MRNETTAGGWMRRRDPLRPAARMAVVVAALWLAQPADLALAQATESPAAGSNSTGSATAKPAAKPAAKPGARSGTKPGQSKKPAAGRSTAKPAAAGTAGAAAGAAAAAPAAAGDARSQAPVAGGDVPYDCRDLDGVSREVCVQCADVPIYKRVVCEQKVFWSLCKGKRLFTDSYCQQNQSLGRGEGG